MKIASHPMSRARIPRRRPGESGLLMGELYAAMAIFSLLVLAAAAPLAMDQKLLRQSVHRAVAMEVVDGEMEILAAGAWRSYEPGEREHTISCAAADGLPPGRFVLNIDDNAVVLEWRESLGAAREITRVRREFRRRP